jgi:hypothetical protein
MRLYPTTFVTNFSLEQLLHVELFVACSETAGRCARPLLRWSIPGELYENAVRIAHVNRFADAVVARSLKSNVRRN